ncbi:MAG: hypothetical protein SPK03_07620 [Alloprevotella sp.]|nr:hypothetical protein [Alloprevotella sp.]
MLQSLELDFQSAELDFQSAALKIQSAELCGLKAELCGRGAHSFKYIGGFVEKSHILINERAFSFVIPLTLHYLCFAKIGCGSATANKKQVFLCRGSHLALSLLPKNPAKAIFSFSVPSPSLLLPS